MNSEWCLTSSRTCRPSPCQLNKHLVDSHRSQSSAWGSQVGRYFQPKLPTSPSVWRVNILTNYESKQRRVSLSRFALHSCLDGSIELHTIKFHCRATLSTHRLDSTLLNWGGKTEEKNFSALRISDCRLFYFRWNVHTFRRNWNIIPKSKACEFIYLMFACVDDTHCAVRFCLFKITKCMIFDNVKIFSNTSLN